MKIQKKLSALRRSDAATDRKIAELYPADWDMDAVFRKSWKKYRQQAGDTAEAAEPLSAQEKRENIRITGWTHYAAAACLILTVGITGVIGWQLVRHAQTPPVIIQESTLPADAVQPAETTRSDDSGSSTEQTQQTAESSPSDSGAAVTLTTPEPHSTANTPAVTTSRTGEQTTLTSDTSRSTTAGTTVSTTAKTTVSTTLLTEPEPGEQTQDAGMEPPPPDQTEEPPSGGTQGTQYGFKLVDDPDKTEIQLFYYFEDQTYLEGQPVITVTDPKYQVVQEAEAYKYKNTVTDTETGTVFNPRYSAGVYSMTVLRRTSASIRETTVFGQIAYLITRKNETELVFFDGKYLCYLPSKTGTEEELIRLAEALRTH